MRYDNLYISLKEQANDQIPDSARIASVAFQFIQKATVIRLGRDHVRAITQNPGPQPQNWNVIHPVFPCIHVEFEGGFVDENMNIVNMTIVADEVLDDDTPLSKNAAPKYAIMGFYYGYDLENSNQPTIWRLPSFAYDAQGEPIESLREAAWGSTNGIARNILDFLALPSVRVDVEPGMAKINRSRRKKNKAPLTDYHVVNWSDTSHPNQSSNETGIKHRVRYDVRGNWATFTQGTFAGRRIWRRAHQRGPVDAPFRMKGYQL